MKLSLAKRILHNPRFFVALGIIASRCQRRGDPGFLDCFPLRNLVVAMTGKLQPSITLNAVMNLSIPIYNTFAKVSEGEGEMGFRVYVCPSVVSRSLRGWPGWPRAEWVACKNL